MKHKLFLNSISILSLLFFLSILLTANENTPIQISENGGKIYLQPSEIIINSHGIFFCVDGEFFRTEVLNYDENGLNVPLAPMYWICKNGHINPLYRYPCGKCGAGAPGT